MSALTRAEELALWQAKHGALEPLMRAVEAIVATHVAAERARVDAVWRARVEALAAEWEKSEPHRSGAFYPEASAYSMGRDHQRENDADILRDLIAEDPS